AQRLGLRFINRIELPVGERNFEGFIMPHPVPPMMLNLPFQGFFQHEVFAVPGYPYTLTLVRTTSPPQDPQLKGLGLILDIDVSSVNTFALNDQELKRRLTEMRWLKNKAFFGSLTEKAVGMFR